jgi:hypothetical protein
VTVGFIEGFKQGLAGEPDPTRFEVSGKQVVCAHCQGSDFDCSTALLNTAGLTFLGFDWANREAHVLACKRCGAVQWFLQEPKPI